MGDDPSKVHWDAVPDPNPSPSDVDLSGDGGGGKCYKEAERGTVDVTSKKRSCTNDTSDGKGVDDDPKQPIQSRATSAPDSFLHAMFVLPEYSTWCSLYLRLPDEQQVTNKFQQMFRMPFGAFLELVEKVELNERFHQWLPKDEENEAVPSLTIKLLLMGALRRLIHNHSFLDSWQMSAISEGTHREFYELFATEFREDELTRKHFKAYESKLRKQQRFA